MPSLEILTDEAILDYTRSGNVNRVLYDHRDLDLNYSYLKPYRGGIYDVDIFGSPIQDRCLCGKIKTVSPEPCPNCGARVYSRDQGLRRFARIELPFYYMNSLRFNIFTEFFYDTFRDSKITLKFSKDNLKGTGWVAKNSMRKLSMKVFDSCQFEYNIDNQELIVSEYITDMNKCSYEGLIKIMEDYFPDRVAEMKNMVNKYILVLPAMMRPFSVVSNAGTGKSIALHKASTWYEVIIRLCCEKDKEAGSLNYRNVINSFKTEGEKVKYTALLKALINSGRKELTELLESSKENLARGLYSVRTQNSARCPIVPSTELPIDEVGIPVHLAYEMCRSGFIKRLQKEPYNFSEEEAKKSTLKEPLHPEIQKAFKEYAETQKVLINRPPTLHEYNIISLKLRIVPDYAIHLPIRLCEPLGGDYDGDQISVHLLPEDIADDTFEKMSPRYVHLYKKNLTPIKYKLAS